MKNIIYLLLLTAAFSACERPKRCGDPNALNYDVNGAAADSCYCKYKLYDNYEVSNKLLIATMDTTINADTIVTTIDTIIIITIDSVFNVDSMAIDTVVIDTITNTTTIYTTDTSYIINEKPVALFSFYGQRKYTTSGECGDVEDEPDYDNKFRMTAAIKNIHNTGIKVSFKITFEDLRTYEDYKELNVGETKDLGVIKTANVTLHPTDVKIKIISIKYE